MIQAIIRGDGAYVTACCLYAVLALGVIFTLRRIKISWMHIPRIEVPAQIRGGISLRLAAAKFLSIRSLRLLFAGLVASLIARIALGSWTPWDLLIVAATIAIWPFQEWFFHSYFLHLKPFKLLGFTIEPVFVKTHRGHHLNPRQLGSGVIPFYFVTVYLLGLPLIWCFGLPLAQALTGIVASLVLIYVYEWMHFLIHTTYKPRSKWYLSLWRNHRLHHFKNENHWYGVTTTVADVALGTCPAKESIENSKSCLTLGAVDDLD